MANSSTELPNYAKCHQPDLEYAYWRTPEDEEEQMDWQKLEDPLTAPQTPPGPALSSAGLNSFGLQLVQSTGKDIKCTLSWGPGEYGICAFRERETNHTDVLMVFTPSQPPVIECDEAAKDFPLAKLFDASAHDREIRIRLTLNANRFKPKVKSRRQCIDRLRYLTSSSETSTNETTEGDFVMSTKTISRKEAKEQAKPTDPSPAPALAAQPAIRPTPVRITSSIGHSRESSMQAPMPPTPLAGAAQTRQSSTALAKEYASLERKEEIQRLA